MEYRAAFSRAEVPSTHARFVLAEVFERDEVALGEVEDVDVVADRSAVGGVIVCDSNV